MTTKSKPRARRKKAAKPVDNTPRATGAFDSEDFIRLLRDTWDESLITYRLDGFYTPVDGWKPRKGGMQTNTDVLLQVIHESRRADPWGYWAAVRGHMI